jgi:hypothetical protein
MSEKKMEDRVFFAFARYGSSVSGGKMYDCCAVMIIRCTNRTPVFLMMEVGSVSEEVQSWEGYEKIKHFFVMPEVPIDYDKLARARLKYWDMNKHIYEESRLIQIDTHRPGDLTVERASTVQLENSWKMWTIKHGPRDILATAILPEAPRVSQMKENAQLRDAQTAITTKNAKINDLEKKLALLQTQLKAKATAPPSTSNKRDLQAVQEEEMISPTFKKRVVMTETSRKDNSGGFLPVQYTTRPTAHHANSALVEMSQELKKTELEKSISQNRIRILELQLLAAQKQTALLDAKNEQTVAKARHNLELNGIHIDQREMQQAARNRMNAIHDEDRTWQKESARRQWLVEDRQVSASRILDLAHELPTLQTLLSAQHGNTALAAMHPFMRPLPNSVAVMQSTQQQFVQQQQGSMPYSPPPQPASAVAASAVAAAAVAAAAEAAGATTSSSSTTPMQWTPTAIPVSNGQTTLEEQEEAELSAKVLDLERQLAEEYARHGNQ